MSLPNLFFRVAVKRNLSVSDHLTRRSIPSYCVPARDRWCAVIYDQSKYKAATILEATGGIAIEIKDFNDEKAHINLWHGTRKMFWILIDKERGEATFRPDMMKSLLNHLTSKRSEMQFLREMTMEELENEVKLIGEMSPENGCMKFLDLLEIKEVNFPPFEEIDKHFDNAATTKKQSFWVS